MSEQKRDRGLSRDRKIDRTKVNADSRTVELAFSSEEPVERWGENEVLSHETGDYDFSRLNDSHPLLLGHNEHDPMSQIGVIENARVDGDKVGRAVVRFGKGDLAQEIFQDVQDGIRNLVSVGYDRTAIISSKKDPKGMPTVRYRWTPTHIAIVPVPADTTVGVGRSVDSKTKVEVEELNLTPEEIKRMKILLDKESQGGGGAAAVDPAVERAAIQAAARKQASDITRMADTFEKDHGKRNQGKFATDIRRMAQSAIEAGTDLPTFRADLMEATMKAQEADTVSLKALGVKRGEYSLGRAIRSCIEKDSKVPGDLEGEVHAEMMKRDVGISVGGFLIPFDAEITTDPSFSRSRMRRDLQATVFNTGGAMVPTELIVPPIELLRNRLISSTLGVRMLSGLTGGNIVIPRQTAPATAQYATEIQALTASNLLLDQIAMQPHRCGVQTLYSKQLLLQASGSVETLIYDDAFQVMALLMDLGVIAGSGAASQPLGILNTPGIGSVTFGATATYAKILAFENSLDVANADSDASAWVVTPTVKNAWKGLAVTLTGATTVIGGPSNALWVGKGRDGEVAGYRACSTNQMPSNLALFGDFTACMMAMWGGFDVVLDPYTKAGNAEYVLTMNAWYDVAVRHPQKFCASADAANQ